MTYGTKYNSYSTKYHHDVVGFAIIDSPAPILYTGLGSILISALSETKIYNFKYMYMLYYGGEWSTGYTRVVSFDSYPVISFHMTFQGSRD